MLSVGLCRRNEVVAVFDDWGLGYADGISSAGGPQKLLISEKEGLEEAFEAFEAVEAITLVDNGKVTASKSMPFLYAKLNAFESWQATEMSRSKANDLVLRVLSSVQPRRLL